ncbi:MAG: hypothetical protein Q7J98_08745, partial [Kiritimatiellia bacterium]|nr:hypothetical protein [Kiritimatiellia bacterium]
MAIHKLSEAPWHYYIEDYPRGTKLCVLVLNSRDMYGKGGAVIPTVAWMAEAAGYVFDVYWAEFYEPRMHKYIFFGNHVMEQLFQLD